MNRAMHNTQNVYLVEEPTPKHASSNRTRKGRHGKRFQDGPDSDWTNNIFRNAMASRSELFRSQERGEGASWPWV